MTPPTPTNAQKRMARDFIVALAGHADVACTWQTFDDTPGVWTCGHRELPWRSRCKPDKPCVDAQDSGCGLAKDWRKARILHGSLREVGPTLVTANVAGSCGVFVTINATDLTGRKVANVQAVRALFCDFDGTEPSAWHLPPSVVVRSAHGPHAYWLVSDCGLSEFTHAQKRLIAHYGSDPKLHDLNRVLRVPGFWHQKRKPFMVTLEQAPGHHYTTAQVLAGLPELPQDPPRRVWTPRPGAGRARWRDLDPVQAFADAGLYGRALNGGKHSVVCPWTSNHSKADWRGMEGSTVIWEQGATGAPVFYCSHASCAGRTLSAALQELGAWQAGGQL